MAGSRIGLCSLCGFYPYTRPDVLSLYSARDLHRGLGLCYCGLGTRRYDGGYLSNRISQVFCLEEKIRATFSKKQADFRATEVFLPSANFKRTLLYVEAIDQAGGRASRMAFYNIAGNEENLRRWEQKLCSEWRIIEKIHAEDGRDYYRKTTLGDHLHTFAQKSCIPGQLIRRAHPRSS